MPQAALGHDLGATFTFLEMRSEQACVCYFCLFSFHVAVLQASFQRSNSHDKVRKIVAEEGRAARNLIAWSVPLENKEEEGKYTHTNGIFSRAAHDVHIPTVAEQQCGSPAELLAHYYR